MHFWGGVVSVLCHVSLVLDSTNTPSLVTITVSLLRELLITELARERLSADMRSNVVFDVGKLGKRFRAFETPKASVHAVRNWVLFIKDSPLFVLFFDHFWFFRLSGWVNDIVIPRRLKWLYIIAFQPLLIKAYQVVGRRFKNTVLHGYLFGMSIPNWFFLIWPLNASFFLLARWRGKLLWHNFLLLWPLAFNLAQALEHCVVSEHVKGGGLRLKILLRTLYVDRRRSSSILDNMILLIFWGGSSHAGSGTGILSSSLRFQSVCLELLDSPEQALLRLRDFTSYHRDEIDKIKVDLAGSAISKSLHKVIWLRTVENMIVRSICGAEQRSFKARSINLVLEVIFRSRL